MRFDFKEQAPTATIELETDLGLMRFEVRHVGIDQMTLDYQQAERVSGRMRAALSDAIVGWNLDKPDGTPWPCNEETKEKIIPQISGVLAKEKEGPGGDRLALGIILFIFAADEKNFLKN